MKLFFKRKKKIDIDSENFVEFPKNKHLKIKIKGKNNRVIIPQTVSSCNINISIYGNNNTVMINSNCNLHIVVKIGVEDSLCQNAHFEIGEGTAINDAHFMLLENDSSITIGKDCMFSCNIEVWCSDTHSICDKEGHLLNIGQKIEIGNHVWIGKDCHITKNTKISDNSIVGWCSNVTKKFEESNVIIAGNPAQIVKRGINWRKERPQKLIDEGIL